MGTPDELPAPLSIFIEDLRAALGERLVSVVLHGGVAKGDEFLARAADVEVLILLRDGSVDTLGRVSAPLRRASRRMRIAEMVLTEADLRTSTDVFPVRFDDIQRHHRVLHGEDPFEDLTVSREHYRLRCEQEIKNLLLRLRATFARRSHRRRLLAETLVAASRTFVDRLGAILILRDGEAPTRRAEIVEEAGRRLEVDVRPLQEALALARGRYRPSRDELRKLYGRFLAVVEHAARIVDADGADR